MLKEENGDASKNWARRCDTCQSAASTVYCRADAAYLCTGCEARIHAANLVHEREWVCESCERAPAVFLCKADAATLCTTCDAIIHSANPLARRHRRIPIFPIPYGASAASPSATPSPTEDLEEEASSWLLLNPVKNSENQGKNNDGKLLGEVDGYLDLNEYHLCQEIHITDDQYNNNDQKTYGGDSFVQVQYGSKGQLGLEYEVSDAGYVGVVPESRLNEVSSVSQLALNGTVDLFSSPPIQLSAVDREARVLRYREKKKKKRKFEKKIRYASRKAYAETRPRIKGRFAKRTDVH